MRRSKALFVLSLVAPAVAMQIPFAAKSPPPDSKSRPLTGRFLHITDLHPDPHYQPGSAISGACHDQQKAMDHDEPTTLEDDSLLYHTASKEPTAGHWGSGVTDCDSPMSLINMTFDWLEKEWRNEVDFVIWTGDSARHDIDRSRPRTPKEIFDQNRMMVQKMQETFPDIPIIPSLGNNDVYPHNVLAPGPNSVTEEFLQIWGDIVPQDLSHVFERGGHFAVEVIPDRLAVISMNTMYWFSTNTLVDGCREKSTDPGALELDWLAVQLDLFRQRGMQVWLSGHVPPHMGMYYENCYLRYGDLALRFQDTIVGHVFGHMNVDHFFFIDVSELEASNGPTAKVRQFYDNSSNIEIRVDGPLPRQGPVLSGSGRMRTMGRAANAGLQDELKKDFGEMPGPAKLKLKDYAVINVAPSVVPTYLPGIRIYSYNISGLEGPERFQLKKKKKPGHGKKKPKDECDLPENEDKPHCVFKKSPRYYDKNSPSRKNGPLTPLGYTQFYLPDVDAAEKNPPSWKVEYSTFKPSSLLPDETEQRVQPPPIPYHLLPGWNASLSASNAFYEDVRITMKNELKNITPWKLKDLTIKSYVKLARRLVIEKSMWKKFQEIMFVSST